LLKSILEKNESAKILEIGPGYGAIAGFVAENYNLENYYAIDVNPLFKYKKLFKTDGKTIPKQVPNDLDVVYSVNVFQHLTPEQRLSYFEQIKDKLVVGGKFIFSMFVVAPDTEEIMIQDPNSGHIHPIFGFQDKQGNYYTNFFSQLTRCNTMRELIDIFTNLNMKLELISKTANSYCICATKM
jgi:cyclopropane fatty-acyl-phospholipid synthase-like methyltransferase